MKRRFFSLSLSLALLMMFSLVLSASADLIWEPFDDSFYTEHFQECTYVGRNYQLAGYDGTVTVFTAPSGMSKVTLDNGIQGNIQFTWKGYGITWGYLCWLTGIDVQGWVAMDDMAKVYDSQQFMEDHQEEIQGLNQDLPVNFQEAVLYSYPNGPTTGETLKEFPDYSPFSQAFSSLYTDENGFQWGYIGYYMGSLRAWVCLDDPMNEDLDTQIVPVPLSPAQMRGSATVTAGRSLLPVAIGLIAAVTVVTVVLILKLKKRS